jgi:hypothetical protein
MDNFLKSERDLRLPNRKRLGRAGTGIGPIGKATAGVSADDKKVIAYANRVRIRAALARSMNG